MIAIKDMDMPNSCATCDIRSGSYCYAKNKPPYNIKGNLLTRDDDCPLVEIEERKVGKWIEERDDYGDVTGWHCSNCYDETGFVTTCAWDYCPNCGAEMRGSENE